VRGPVLLALVVSALLAWVSPRSVASDAPPAPPRPAAAAAPAEDADAARGRLVAGAAAGAGLALALALLVADRGRALPAWVASLSVSLAIEHELPAAVGLGDGSAPFMAWLGAAVLMAQWALFERLRPGSASVPAVAVAPLPGSTSADGRAATAGLQGWGWLAPAGLLLAAGLAPLGGNVAGLPAQALHDLAMACGGALLLAWPGGGARGWSARWRWPASPAARPLALALLACWGLQVLAWPGWPGWPDAAARFARDLVPLAGGALAVIVLALRRLERGREAAQRDARLRERDERHRRELQAAVEARTAEMRQAMFVADAANRGKTDFLARVGHDLRSPLASITGYAQLLEAEPGRAGRHARVIRRSAVHMLQLINDLLEFARGSTAEQADDAPVYLHAVLDAVAHDARMLAAVRGNRFALRLEDPLPTVVVTDAKRLRQVLGNLLDNAAKYTRQGLIDLAVHCAPDDHAGRVRLRFEVRDTGEGMTAADQASAFEPFFRGQGAGDRAGSGLGLPIVKAWVQRLGGEVNLRSARGVGTEVSVTLPVALGRESDLAPGARMEVPELLPQLEGQGRRLWVIEDTPEILQLLTDELSHCGFRVHGAPDGAAFLAAMARDGEPVPDLVLTDYLMPGADGAAVLDGVRRHWPGVPVVLLSATPLGMGGNGSPLGFDATLLKPVDLGVLRRTLARVLTQAGGRDMRPTEGAPPHAPWQEQGAPDPSDGAAFPEDGAPTPWRRLPPAQRDTLRLLVAMGAMSDLVDWGERVAGADAALLATGRWVAARAGEADLAGIRRWMADGVTPEGAPGWCIDAP
jgi:signal transduction histidine kinase/DNA-binding NarL/FixJ family response regulator